MFSARVTAGTFVDGVGLRDRCPSYDYDNATKSFWCRQSFVVKGGNTELEGNLKGADCSNACKKELSTSGMVAILFSIDSGVRTCPNPRQSGSRTATDIFFVSSSNIISGDSKFCTQTQRWCHSGDTKVLFAGKYRRLLHIQCSLERID